MPNAPTRTCCWKTCGAPPRWLPAPCWMCCRPPEPPVECPSRWPTDCMPQGPPAHAGRPDSGDNMTPAEQALRDAAFEYHRSPGKGKISVTPTKPLSNQRDLSLAYSPGVAYPCLAIEADPSLASEYTARGNLVGVITNGTAVLGLGDIGPLASKPVMEGKGC